MQTPAVPLSKLGGGRVTFDSLPLSPSHAALLQARAIDPKVAALRGVYTARQKTQLLNLGFSPKRLLTPSLVIPMHNVLGDRVNYAIRPDVPRIVRGRQAKYEPIAGSELTVDVPLSIKSELRNASSKLVITEGPLKADSAISHGLACIAIFGVWNVRGRSQVLADWDAMVLKGRNVFLCFDSDMMYKSAVHQALSRLRDLLTQWGATVRVVYLPVAPDGSKTGLDDFLAQGHAAREVFELADRELRPLSPEILANEDARDGRPALDVGQRDLAKVTPEAWRLLAAGNDPPRLVEHGSELVRLESSPHSGPTLAALKSAGMWYELARAAYCYTVGGQGDSQAPRPAVPPDHVLEDMLATEHRPLPKLDRIVEAPVFGHDGSLQVTPGYDPVTRAYYAASPGLEIPTVSANPSPAEREEARRLILDELLVDFAFEKPAHRAHAVALLLAPFMRDMIAGGTPQHMVEAPEVGTGKTLLVDVALAPAFGREVAKIAQVSKEEEQRKRITSQLLMGSGAICIDNVTGTLRSGALAAVLTMCTWEDRLLGGNRMVRVPVRCIWVMTSNNPQLSTEMARRSVPIRLNADRDEPWRRDPEAFRHSLPAWAFEHRGKLIWAALTLARAWLAAGRPRHVGKRLASFESWSDVIGGILDVAGISGFLEELDSLYERADAEKAVWQSFVARWHEKHGHASVSTADPFPLAVETEGLELRGDTDSAKRISFGKNLRPQVGRVFGSYQVSMAGKRQGAQQWSLQAMGGGEGGEGGESLSFHTGTEGVRERADSATQRAALKIEGGQNTLTSLTTLTEQDALDLAELDAPVRE